MSDVEVPLRGMVVLTAGSPPAQVQGAVADHGCSRYILTDGDGLPEGYLHLTDVLDLIGPSDRGQPVPTRRIRTLGSVARTSDLEDALASMRRAGHVATSYDADGTPSGALILEDIIDELVGEVEDATSA